MTNCFQWQSHLSDYLDGLLIGGQKADIDTHLEGCTNCLERYQHYRSLQQAIREQTRIHLPVTLQKSPLERPLAKTNNKKTFSAHTWWIRLPWYFKFLIEGLAIVLLAFTLVKSTQQIIVWQEKSIDDQFEKIDTSIQPQKLSDLPPGFSRDVPISADNADSATRTAPAAAGSNEFEDDTVSAPLDDYAEDDEAAGDSVEVGKSEVWRFYFKTDAPDEIRNKVVALLKQISLFDGTPNTLGMEAPGGIQFDLIASATDVPTIKRAIESLNPKTNEQPGESPLSQPFTWYKKKSREPLPSGKARVIIWLSQL